MLDLARKGTLAQLARTGPMPEAEGWALEPKWDGARLLVGHENGKVHVLARSGNSHAGKLPALEADIASLPDGTWLDGELVGIVIEDGRIRCDWGRAQSVMSSRHPSPAAADALTFMAFDLLAWDGMDARTLSFAERRLLLERLFGRREFTAVALTPQLEPTEASVEALIAQGMEGAMVKRLDAPYRSGRAAGWLKIKAVDTIDVVVTGFTEGSGGFAGLVGAMTFALHDGAGLVEAGKCSGFDLATRQAMTLSPDEYIGAVAEVAYMGRTESGAFRHPVFKRWRPDKDPADCHDDALALAGV